MERGCATFAAGVPEPASGGNNSPAEPSVLEPALPVVLGERRSVGVAESLSAVESEPVLQQFSRPDEQQPDPEKVSSSKGEPMPYTSTQEEPMQQDTLVLSAISAIEEASFWYLLQGGGSVEHHQQQQQQRQHRRRQLQRRVVGCHLEWTTNASVRPREKPSRLSLENTLRSGQEGWRSQHGGGWASCCAGDPYIYVVGGRGTQQMIVIRF